MSEAHTLDLRWIRGKTPNWGDTIRQAEVVAGEILAKEQKTDPDEGIRMIQRLGREVHAGDCHQCRSWLTAPVSCSACIYDEYMVKAWRAIEALEAPDTTDSAGGERG